VENSWRHPPDKGSRLWGFRPLSEMLSHSSTSYIRCGIRLEVNGTFSFNVSQRHRGGSGRVKPCTALVQSAAWFEK
jgi:hypothetical protein